MNIIQNGLRLMVVAIAMVFAASPAAAQTALSPQEISQIVNGPCAGLLATARAGLADFGIPWDVAYADLSKEMPQDLPVAEVDKIIDKYEYYLTFRDDLSGPPNDAKLCLLRNKLKVAASHAPAAPAPGAGNSSGTGGSYSNGPVQGGSAVASVAGNGDVFAQCVRLDRYPDSGGIETVWSLTNICNATVDVKYCFSANVEAAGDPNLCSRQENRYNEIRPGSKLDFAFTPVEEGQAMSDGTIAGPNNLVVHGFACANGSAPNTYFDGKRFMSRGC